MSDMPTSTTSTDAQLVAAHVAGDRSALAAIHDRYADSLYDTAAAMTRDRHDAADVMQDVFVAAAERMGRLRDADRLKPWLFAILRNEVYRRSGKRKRVVVTDFTDSGAEMSLPTEPPVAADDAEYHELAQLVRDAAAGLDERDQLVLEYSIRQRLEGDDLADALGATPQQCYSLVHRMRQRTERSLGAFCVARTGRKDCAELAQILGDWDGQFSVLVRKQVARHVDKCDVCERSRRKLAPFAMFDTAPAFAAPAELRQRVLAAAEPGGGAPVYGFAAPGGFPTVIKYARRIVGWLMLTVLAVLIAGAATVFVLLHDGDPEPAVAAATGTTSLATTTTTGVPTTTTPSGTSLPAVPVVSSQPTSA
jgi:RNA polymerase sigma factor (sigma-70 family)